MQTADHHQITLDEILALHDDVIGLGKGLDGVARLEAILGAIGRPYHGYHETLEEKAAALLHAVASAHGFVDGNKRTALSAALFVIDMSGFRVVPRAGENIDDVPVDLIEGRMSQDDLVAWFRERLAPL